MLSDKLRESSVLLDCNNSRGGSQEQQHEDICPAEQMVYLQDCFLTAHSSPVTESHQKPHQDQADTVSFSLDMVLERLTQRGKPNVTCAETTQLQFDAWSTMEKESSSEYCSLDSIQMNKGIIQSGDLMGICSTREIPEEKRYRRESTVDDDESITSFEDQNDSFYSIMEDDKSIVFCQTSPTSDVVSSPVTANSEAAGGDNLTADQSLMKTAVAFTQTEDPATADKHVNTEVHMADLDYLAEEFIKLTATHEKPKGLKEKIKSTCCKLRKECDCIQRAQQAELCLLALQYSMCRQHCWRLYYTSAEGGQLPPMHGDLNLDRPKDPPGNIVTVVKTLESDYNQMRDKILAGVPLEQLKPLSVDCEQIIKGTSYTPTQFIGDVLGNLPPWGSQQTQKHETPSEGTGYSDGQNSKGCQNGQRQQNPPNWLTLVPQERVAFYNAHKPEEKQTRSASDETKSSVLRVSNLPSDVTEGDVMLWFEKYHVSEASISTLKNDLRVAIVMVSGHQSAEAAVSDLNDCSMQGHTLYVEQINRATAESQSQTSTSISGPESSQDATKPQTSKTDSSSTNRKLISQPPPGSSIKNRNMICSSPTAKGTCVPQRYGTMGSFDTLMAELTQRHPDIGKQMIADALIELRRKHQGILSGLPIRTIREMTSDLLTRPRSATQL